MPEVVPEIETFASIKVAGIGGGGTSAINRMAETGIKGVEFIAVNTDAQSLHNALAKTKLHIGKQTTRGLGAGADPSVGRQAAEESREEIKQTLAGADMVFITFGAGGGTGSGGAPIVAEIAKQMGILTIAIVTRPFAFEGEKRRRNAEGAIATLREHVDTLITIPNDRLLQTIDRKTPLLEAFSVVDDVLRQGVQGISELITVNGLINLDFADIKSIMSNAGSALMGIGRASGEDRAIVAAKQAIESPLLEVSVDGARGVLFSVTGGKDMGMHEINEAAETITAAVDPEANIIFGANIDEKLEDEIKITVIATGFDAAYSIASNTGGAYSTTSFAQDDEDQLTDTKQNISTNSEITRQDEKDIDLNDNDDEEQKAEDIWAFSNDDDDFDVPAFVRKDKKKK
jgi:cell division protein FtsZ